MVRERNQTNLVNNMNGNEMWKEIGWDKVGIRGWIVLEFIEN